MRILLVNFTGKYHRAVAQKLAQKNATIAGVFHLPGYSEPRSVVVQDLPDITYEADPVFKTTRLLDIRDWQYADRIVERLATSKFCPSSSFLEKMRDCETVFMRQADRFSFYHQSTSSLRRIYYGLLSGLMDLLEELAPDLIFFSDSPHVGYDTIVFFLARYLGIRTALIEGTHIDNTVMLIESYLDAAKVPESFMRESSLEELQDELSRQVPMLKLDRSRAISYIHARHEKLAGSGGNTAGRLRAILLRINKAPGRAFRLANAGVYSRALIYNSLHERSDLKLAKIRYNKTVKLLKNALNKNCSNGIDPGRPFVFFPLHMQPEKTTSTFGGAFEDQYLAVKMLAAAIPPDWVVAVKEHPVQLIPDLIERRNYRDAAYYSLLAGMPKVVLLPPEAPYDELMSHSRVNATITGSIGWESLLLGKAPIVFGNNWYSKCRACLTIGSVEECKAALEICARLSPAAVREELIRFVLYYKNDFKSFSANPTRMHLFDVSTQEQIERYADAIMSFRKAAPDRTA